MVPKGGYSCNCGKTGCLETVASATGVVRVAREKLKSSTEDSVLRDLKVIGSKQVFDAARTGDSLALKIVDQLAYYLGLSLANLGNAVNPEKIVIGGGVSKAGKTLLEPVMNYFKRFAFPKVRTSTTIDIATLENDAGVIGAAWLVKNAL